MSFSKLEEPNAYATIQEACTKISHKFDYERQFITN